MPELWPFAASGRITEVLEARTDVLQTRASEQRIALRTAPREIVTLTHRLHAFEMAQAAELARAGFANDWLVPLWHLAAQPTVALAQGSDVVAFNTTHSDFRAGGQAAIAVDGGPAALVSITSVSDDALTLAEPMVLQLPEPVVAPSRALVAPVRTGILTTPVEISRRRQGDGTVTATFLLAAPQAGTQSDDPPVVAALASETFLGRPVLTTPSILRQPLAATLARAVEYIDNSFGPVVVEPVRDVFTRGEAVTLKSQDAAARRDLRDFLVGLNGRQQSFWLPSWGRELQLTEPLTSGGIAMRIRPAAGIAAYASRAIMFETPSGLACRSIVSAAEDGLEHVLTLSASLGTAVPVTTLVHFLTLSRSDADRFEIVHGVGASEVTFPVIEVPA
ncbi:hypothetical protein [Amaricoccus macauensis]|uniref:hypothetical protein n=1 Tax=Amaricoccus macauensis TaxID=57001 RepID=UPI003C7A474B